MTGLQRSILNENSDALLQVVASIPLLGEVGQVIQDCENAVERGYFLPDEDDRVMRRYVGYLNLRQTLLEIVRDIQRELEGFEESEGEHDWNVRLNYFAVGFTASLVLVRVGKFIVEMAERGSVIQKKLDDAESRFGLSRKSFATLYSSLTDPLNSIAFYEAVRFYEVHEEDIYGLESEVEGFADVLDLLREEIALLDYKKRDAILERLKYRLYSFRRRSESSFQKMMFHLFRLSGSQIAELKQPHIAKEGKNVNTSIKQQAKDFLHPGDVIVTRHIDALSNLFLPGFWPHVALYIGDDAEREQLGVDLVASEVDILEAKKDGVKLRALEETLEVDSFLILRPTIEEIDLKSALQRSLSHSGKRYDFLFDFSEADRLACTEVIYRGFHGVGEVSFELIEKAGRVCLPAEELIAQSLSNGTFQLVGCFIEPELGFHTGEDAQEAFFQHKKNIGGER